MADTDFIMIRAARVSFPHLFRPPVINGEEGKCGATLMLDPADHADEIAEIEAAIAALCTQHFKGRQLPSDKLCLRSGEDKGRSEYDGLMVLSANNRTAPLTLVGLTKVEDEKDSPIYAGCLVNAKVRLWAQNNQYGRRINCELVAIQFHGDGDPLDGSYVSEDEAMDGFADVEDDFLSVA